MHSANSGQQSLGGAPPQTLIQIDTKCRHISDKYLADKKMEAPCNPN